ncbi:hypothetical protein D3C80_1709540 [compost metagenome]
MTTFLNLPPKAYVLERFSLIRHGDRAMHPGFWNKVVPGTPLRLPQQHHRDRFSLFGHRLLKQLDFQGQNERRRRRFIQPGVQP